MALMRVSHYFIGAFRYNHFGRSCNFAYGQGDTSKVKRCLHQQWLTSYSHWHTWTGVCRSLDYYECISRCLCVHRFRECYLRPALAICHYRVLLGPTTLPTIFDWQPLDQRDDKWPLLVVCAAFTYYHTYDRIQKSCHE